MSPYRRAIEDEVVPWSKRHGFSRASAHVFFRPSPVAEVLEVIGFQKSCKHPHRSFTINLGFYHPSYTTSLVPSVNEIEAAHCGRHIRLGCLMPSGLLRRLPTWVRFGSGWHPWQAFSGDFWWCYNDANQTILVALRHALKQIELHGFSWFQAIASVQSATVMFDRSQFNRYEMSCFAP